MLALVAASFNTGEEVLRDIFEMRRLLEPPIAALAAQRTTRQELDHMAEIIAEQQQQIDAGNTGVESDTAFHFALASATNASTESRFWL